MSKKTSKRQRVGHRVEPLVGQRLFCSRFWQHKRDVDRDAAWFRRHDGTQVCVIGQRGGPWRVRGKLPVHELASFCSNEARRECLKRSN